jgi:hypothetical protein
MSDQIPQQQYEVVSSPKDSTLAIVSLVCGISAYVFLPLLGAIAAVITGHLAKKEIKESGGTIKGSGMATAGLILGYIQLAMIVLSICAIVLVLPAIGSSISDIFSNIGGSLY